MPTAQIIVFTLVVTFMVVTLFISFWVYLFGKPLSEEDRELLNLSIEDYNRVILEMREKEVMRLKKWLANTLDAHWAAHVCQCKLDRCLVRNTFYVYSSNSCFSPCEIMTLQSQAPFHIGKYYIEAYNAHLSHYSPDDCELKVTKES